MTFRVTMWNKDQSTGTVRDYRKQCWSTVPTYQCHGMAMVYLNGSRARPWFIEFEGNVPDRILYSWAQCTLSPSAPRENITINGKSLCEHKKEQSTVAVPISDIQKHHTPIPIDEENHILKEQGENYLCKIESSTGFSYWHSSILKLFKGK